MILLLTTIPHTGTKFWCKVFERHGFEHITWPDMGRQGTYIQDHTTPECLERIKRHHQDLTIITTVRRWDTLRDTWHRRNLQTLNLEAHIKRWLEVLTYDPIIVSFDCQREERLRRLSEHLGMEIKTDWRPENPRDQNKVAGP